jgi:hypothetical protein
MRLGSAPARRRLTFCQTLLYSGFHPFLQRAGCRNARTSPCRWGLPICSRLTGRPPEPDARVANPNEEALMSDFHNHLRNGNPKRFDRDRGRKPFEGPAFRSPDRQTHRDRDRKGGAPPQRRAAEIDLAPLVRALESVAVEAQRLAEAAEARMRIEPRWLSTLEAIAASLERLAASGALTPSDHALPAAATAVPAITGPSLDGARESTIARIRLLRDDGLSFEKIALQLESEGLPTPSGRGKWRGPAVQRLLGLNGTPA